jgi:hypothetical protein
MTSSIPYAVITARIDGSYDLSLDKGIAVIIYRETETGSKELIVKSKE